MKIRRKTYATNREKIRDLFNGFMGWIVLNILVFFIVLRSSESLPLSFLPLLVNLFVLILLAFTRSWMAFGALVAFSFSLFTAAILGGATTFQDCFSYFIGRGAP